MSAVILIARIILSKFGYELDSAFVIDIATLIAGALVVLGIINEPTGLELLSGDISNLNTNEDDNNKNSENNNILGGISMLNEIKTDLTQTIAEKIEKISSVFNTLGLSQPVLLQAYAQDLDALLAQLKAEESNSKTQEANALITASTACEQNTAEGAEKESEEDQWFNSELKNQNERLGILDDGAKDLQTSAGEVEVIEYYDDGLKQPQEVEVKADMFDGYASDISEEIELSEQKEAENAEKTSENTENGTKNAEVAQSVQDCAEQTDVKNSYGINAELNEAICLIESELGENLNIKERALKVLNDHIDELFD